ncbi:F0F1 ATP synthase subunit delta [Eikenella sp. S3360]|uniref:ATP synthase subunit delta n=1 Tax=Eikenella glucosivorans TaxID=2766967 RepID=A0ABS0NCN5_9NEIS|nr:F0F1 ATP synthase subunit delta [Eikenella glucosivorans]MBH5330082.1 F0F1 ATP synthase subunit delta [Eikenella glucosivorans]
MAELATIARPYAKALFELAAEKGHVEAWLEKLTELSWAVSQPKLATFIEDAGVASSVKADTLIGLLESIHTPQYTEFKNFLYVLAEGGRLMVLPDICAQYQEFLLSRDHIQKAVVYSAFPMSEGQFAKVVSDCQQKFGCKLEATLEIVPELIGGIKIEVGDKVLDLSVQGKLKNLYAAMVN